ncbi:type II CRISPR-associated endonuclease Cas1 [Aggregatibacter actinomycetemcomitans]|uniref:type II CRISPR-associated endonuclease Cas1 n=1 Tax=Aggregatibacter actinomycetemcomitans TaxID=714 RepID=UPI00197B8455|nr:type II CRISPR-associated endonuclease Cas1 [Aggregatibacter actinomycetemcomitans]MBN6074352.1 type II CRISPR-associated endonuclease Cas1 [Aggregatibacter actinomycetemcomitans]MBN6076746.1 type II CRISPR-associated endonuclease Cas1 [Aggregatibacter actinomycetemcomitans]
MTWRSILISKGGKLSLKRNQLLLQQEDNEFTVPLEDIAIVIVENRETVITIPLLSAMALNGITLLSCDEQYLPCGQWLPFNQYHRQLKILKLQLEASQPLKKQLWQLIVRQKIRNQAFVLEQTQFLTQARRLLCMAKEVKSGDKENIEGQAALLYFQTAFGKTFRRIDENPINAHLNYAYTILRSAVARALVLYGWLPSLGLFHRSELNPFNLADDFIEPFRPIVDLLVWTLWKENKLQRGLTPTTKQTLIKVLNYQLQANGQVVNVLTSIERTTASLQNALMCKDPNLLKLPEMLPLAEHYYE